MARPAGMTDDEFRIWNAEKSRRLVAARRERGLCPRCGKSKTENGARCDACRGANSQRMKSSREGDREAARRVFKKYYDAHKANRAWMEHKRDRNAVNVIDHRFKEAGDEWRKGAMALLVARRTLRKLRAPDASR